MAKKDLEALTEEMKSLQRRSASTVCSEASTGVGLGGSGTFARLPASASRFSEIFIPRKMEFKGWLTDYKKCSYQELKRPPRSQIPSETYRRWCWINFTSTLTRIKPGNQADTRVAFSDSSQTTKEQLLGPAHACHAFSCHSLHSRDQVQKRPLTKVQARSGRE